MEILKEVLTVVLQTIGLFCIFWLGGYVIEKGKQKACKSVRVCELCFKKIKEFKDVNKD